MEDGGSECQSANQQEEGTLNVYRGSEEDIAFAGEGRG
jgi:hypothetical protein